MTDEGFPTYGGRAKIETVVPFEGAHHDATMWTIVGKENRGICFVTPSRLESHRPEQMRRLQTLADQAINWTDEQWEKWNHDSNEQVRRIGHLTDEFRSS